MIDHRRAQPAAALDHPGGREQEQRSDSTLVSESNSNSAHLSGIDWSKCATIERSAAASMSVAGHWLSYQESLAVSDISSARTSTESRITAFVMRTIEAEDQVRRN